VNQTALGIFVCLIRKRELRYGRFWSDTRNPISYVNTVDFPHKPDLLRTGTSVTNWCQTDMASVTEMVSTTRSQAAGGPKRGTVSVCTV